MVTEKGKSHKWTHRMEEKPLSISTDTIKFSTIPIIFSQCGADSAIVHVLGENCVSMATEIGKDNNAKKKKIEARNPRWAQHLVILSRICDDTDHRIAFFFVWQQRRFRHTGRKVCIVAHWRKENWSNEKKKKSDTFPALTGTLMDGFGFFPAAAARLFKRRRC